MPVVKHTAPLIGALAALIIICLAALAFVLLRGRSGEADGAMADGAVGFGAGTARALSARDLSAEFASLPVPDDEFFLPPEPDFLPPVVLSRERRSVWTAEDAAPFWTDPATLDLTRLAADASALVDAIMERTP
ncbi:MAG: hypothetical protein A2Z99_15945 [Treponema sp. GWB1_62_6]|nr:MAG: hypothetical protein A2Y36_14275 [Treponema sp. GWA1_62_8]OHE66074.1 MAG: hypothetical protein A2001_20145 [Treponema sp. GWC1_61_84]OHE71010.1 MAG: hypothetical protein A2Z99_15945 [Treponema sp. GWB1_62_6]HCM25649.1 hypothetical protein [Treponema sp.]